MFKKYFMPFMAPEGTGGAGEGTDGATQQNNQQTDSGGKNGSHSQVQQPPAFDYDKLADIIAGKQSVTEDTILKNYFKQQGLSKEEADLAMQSFKTQKAQKQPDVNGMQTQLAQYKETAQKAVLEKEAMMEAVALGIDAKTIPYVLKLADFSSVFGQDGKVNQDSLKKAINKVLEDLPQLKPVPEDNRGFQIGSGENVNDAGGSSRSNRTAVTATKRWNRFN